MVRQKEVDYRRKKLKSRIAWEIAIFSPGPGWLSRWFRSFS